MIIHFYPKYILAPFSSIIFWLFLPLLIILCTRQNIEMANLGVQWSIPTGNPDTQCTKLAPFRPNLSGTYYTPDTVRDWMQFGYSYPELQPWNYQTTKEYLLSIYTDIAELYRVTVGDISDSCKKSETAWGGLVLNRSDLRKNIIVHHDYVINVRYGKCVTPSSLALPYILI